VDARRSATNGGSLIHKINVRREELRYPVLNNKESQGSLTYNERMAMGEIRCGFSSESEYLDNQR